MAEEDRSAEARAAAERALANLLAASVLDGPNGTVRARIAGLAGYLFSKSAAARTRGADNDYYDLAYVLLHNHAGGPAEAAPVVRASSLADALPAMRSS